MLWPKINKWWVRGSLVLVAVLLLAVPLIWSLLREVEPEVRPSGWTYPGRGQLPQSYQVEAFAEFGPRSCAECHPNEYADWRGSHHDLANRRIVAREDMLAFLTSPAVYEKDGERFRLHQRAGEFYLEVRHQGVTEDYPIVGLLGVDPLYNFLVAFPDGRVQSTTLGWDVHEKELFDTFDGEERLVGDYGHWLGQGLNWNANCAWCHMTDFKKNLDVETLAYESSWFSQGVTCRQCHPGVEEHVRAAQAGDESVLPQTLTMEQTMQNCYSCHSRRAELTVNKFQPGEHYNDHFSLSLPDEAGLYFADGQILDEVFAGASFQMSAMGHAGVTCMDCHDAHSLGMKLPVMNNAICQQCHSAGLDGAQVIEPASHAFHSPLMEGGRCVDCHMPQRTYMARDPRHDHYFPIPDPFLTLELGVPNACSQCHTDKSVEWAAEWVVEWYGEDFHDRRELSRDRARIFAAAHSGEGDANAILEYLQIEPNPAWRAALTGLFWNTAQTPAVMDYLAEAAGDEHPAIRERAAGLLAVLDPQAPEVRAALQDERRSVRLATLRSMPDAFSWSDQLQADWKGYLDVNADRPQVAFMLAQQSLAEGDVTRMDTFLRNAISLGRNEAEVWRQASILWTEGGKVDDAEKALLQAIALEPDNPQMYWTYGLFLAETGRLDDAIDAFTETLERDPHFPRGTYNLLVALGQAERWDEARYRLRVALRRNPEDRDLQQLQRWLDSQGR